MFPRSCGAAPGKHGTFRDCETWLPRLAAMGFDVLYFPPIHPIGRINRKGKNNTLTPGPDDVGSPWAIGAKEGGHKDILPALGTLGGFPPSGAQGPGTRHRASPWTSPCNARRIILTSSSIPTGSAGGRTARCSTPRTRPKSIRTSIRSISRPTTGRRCGIEIKSIFEFWIEQGVRIFRVDNPHTKPFAMWEWLIGEIKKTTPNAIFLAEAFHPAQGHAPAGQAGLHPVLHLLRLAQHQMGTGEYLTELTQGPGREYFRPNFWPNTPDILTEALQFGGRPMFLSRLVMAATMTANYGIYGPAYEMMEHVASSMAARSIWIRKNTRLRHRGFQELDGPNSLRDFIALVNHIRGTRTRSSTSCTSRPSSMRQWRRRHRRFQGPDREARLHPGPGRQHPLAAAVLSLADARRRLRHFRLPQRHPDYGTRRLRAPSSARPIAAA
jgi:starch synthase (maltosyl-transferring)